MLDQKYQKTLNPNHENTPQTHQNIRTNIKEAIEQLQQDIIFLHKWRENFLQERLVKATKNSDIKYASAIRSIKCERIKRILKKQRWIKIMYRT